ncbi:MAG: substrate-binding domain-containing protein [Terriglobia bacterium]
MPRSFRLLVVLLCATALCVSCGPSYHSSSERYVLISTNTSLPYWAEARAGFTEAAKEMHVQVEFGGPASYSPQQELQAFQNAVMSHPSGILVSPAQASLLQGAIDAAMSKGVPVICFDSDSPGSKRILFVGTDNYEAGLTLGRLAASLMREHGRLAIITIPGQLNLEERLRGIQDALKPYPYIRLYQVLNDRGVSQVADQEVSSVLQQSPDLGGIVCLEASGGPGAAQAVDHAGAGGKVTIAAMDANPETLDWISKGVINATVVQKPYTMGFYGLRFLDDLHHNSVHEFKNWQDAPVSPLPSFVDTGTEVVNRSNLDDYRNALAAVR